MDKTFLAFALTLSLAACSGGGNPLGTTPTPPTTGPEEPPTDGPGSLPDLDTSGPLPIKGTTVETLGATGGREAKSAGTVDGYAGNFAYNKDKDTFSIDNLGFDTDSAYRRGVAVAELGKFAVYESPLVRDPVSGRPIEQLEHRALYGVSRSGQTEFAVVRSGAYTNYGFGGFAYQRNGSVVIPTSGQANFTGEYAGLRDFQGKSGLEYTTGAMSVDVDFDDFDAGSAVKGTVSNRRVFDINGRDITSTLVSAVNMQHGTSLGSLPVLSMVIQPGVMNERGEITGDILSRVQPMDGAGKPLPLQEYETGKYYAVISGNDPDEIAGVVVVKSNDPRYSGIEARETGGFILYRRDSE